MVKAYQMEAGEIKRTEGAFDGFISVGLLTGRVDPILFSWLAALRLAV